MQIFLNLLTTILLMTSCGRADDIWRATVGDEKEDKSGTSEDITQERIVSFNADGWQFKSPCNKGGICKLVPVAFKQYHVEPAFDNILILRLSIISCDVVPTAVDADDSINQVIDHKDGSQLILRSDHGEKQGKYGIVAIKSYIKSPQSTDCAQLYWHASDDSFISGEYVPTLLYFLQSLKKS